MKKKELSDALANIKAHVRIIRRTPDGLLVETEYACGHRYEKLYPRGARVSRRQIERRELSCGAATRCWSCIENTA